jgi:hypothetical protein
MKTKIKQFWKKHKKKILIAGLLAVVAVFVFPEISLAQAGGAAGTGADTGTTAAMGPTQSALDETYQQISKLLTVVNEILQRLLWPVLLLIGGLLKNDILFGAGMEDIMYGIWTNIRDFVNIFFVLVLLGIALYNVLGIESQNFKMKQILPKFVIALIAVNFSFLAVKVVIDSVSVLTTAIFSLPAVVQEDGGKTNISPDENEENEDPNKLSVEKQVCESFYGTSEPITDYRSNVEAAMREGSAMCLPTVPKFTEDMRRFFTRWDSNNAALVLAINMQKIPYLNKVTTRQPNLKGLMLNMAFSAILFAIYAAAFIVLFVVLLVRLVVLWVTIVLSPLMVLIYVLPENIKGLVGGGNDITKKFIQTVVVPIPIATVLTIGYLMLDGMMKAKLPDVQFSSSTLSLSLFASELTTLQDIIVAVGTVAVVWMGVIAASKGTFADKAVEGIEKAVSGAGSFLAGTWKYIPMVPYKGEKYTAAALGEVIQQAPYQRTEIARKQARELMGEFGMGIGDEAQNLQKAKNWDDVKKQFHLAGAAGAAAGDFQDAFHVYISKNRNEYKRKFHELGLGTRGLKTTDNKPILKDSDLEEALKEGKVDSGSMGIIRDQITRGMSESEKKKAEQEKTKKEKEKEREAAKKPAKPAEGAAEGEAAGEAAGEEGAPKATRALSEQQKKNIATATGASLYAGAAGVGTNTKAWGDEEYQKVMGKMQGIVDFDDRIRKANTKEEIRALIEARRKELGGDKKNADRIIKYEIGAVLEEKKRQDASLTDDTEIESVMTAEAPTESGLKYESPKPKKPAAARPKGGGKKAGPEGGGEAKSTASAGPLNPPPYPPTGSGQETDFNGITWKEENGEWVPK